MNTAVSCTSDSYNGSIYTQLVRKKYRSFRLTLGFDEEGEANVCGVSVVERSVQPLNRVAYYDHDEDNRCDDRSRLPEGSYN